MSFGTSGTAMDFRLAARTLGRDPGLTWTAVVMLGLGLGAATAVFSLVNGALLRPLAYLDPERLVSVREVVPSVAHRYPSLPVNARHFTEWRKDCKSVTGMSVFAPASLSLTGSGEAERLDAARVSPNLFRILGVRPTLGRDFLDAEEEEGSNAVAVLTHGLWKRRFGSDPSLTGRTIVLDGRTHVVAGILPPEFRFPDLNVFAMGQAAARRLEIFVPKTFSKEELEELNGRYNYSVVARLAPESSPARLAAEMEAVQARLEALAGQKINQRVLVQPLLEVTVGHARRSLFILLGAVGLLLLIVCVNLANLLLARGETRNRETAVRAALGAGRGRLIRYALIESLLLAAAGGLLALVVAAGSLSLLKQYAALEIPRLDEVRLDGRVIAFCALLVAVTTTLFGLLPAWRSGSGDPQDVLRGGSRGATASPGSVRLRSVLVACETCLGAILLLLAGLLMNSYVRLIRADKGFAAPAVLAVDIGLGVKYKENAARDAFYRRVFENLASQPGVEASAIVSALPLRGETWIDGFARDKSAGAPQRVSVNVRFVSPDYFRTMGIPLRLGRTFSDNDRGRNVTVISAGLAEAFWPGQDAVGRKILRTGGDEWFEVIGVAQDVRAEADKRPVAMMYRGYWDWMPLRTVLVTRASGQPSSVAGAVRAAIRGADPDVPVPQFRTMADVLDESVAPRRLQMLLATAFAVISLLVAGLGVYAVVSYSVARRAQELGVRAALGARAFDLHVLVLRQGMAPVAAGLLAGIAAAMLFGRMLAGLLYEVRPHDPPTAAVVSLTLVLVALAACTVPALRAGRSDPNLALRNDG